MEKWGMEKHGQEMIMTRDLSWFRQKTRKGLIDGTPPMLAYYRILHDSERIANTPR
jgi:hypothetical protein